MFLKRTALSTSPSGRLRNALVIQETGGAGSLSFKTDWKIQLKLSPASSLALGFPATQRSRFEFESGAKQSQPQKH